MRNRFNLVLAVLLLLGGLWTWFGSPPVLSNANAPGETLAQAKAALDLRTNERVQAVNNAAVLDGERGDFEKRGLRLRELTPEQRLIELQNLIADLQLLEQASRASEQERAALKAYDDALMGRTRDLGAIAETLREETWPIVEHLKLYPPPLGLRDDWHPATSDFFATSALTLTNGTLDQQVNAAIEVGKRTFSLRQLRDLDATYRAELESYASKLVSAQTNPPISPLRRILAIFTTLFVLIGLWWAFARSIEPDWWVLIGVIALIGWWLAPMPLAWLFAVLLIGMLVLRPMLMGIVPLLAIPVYFRPRTVGNLRFPLSETLFGLIIAALSIYLLLQWRNGWRPRGLKQWLVRQRWLILIIVGWWIAGGLSLLAPPLTDLRVALREFRRVIIEPTVWALIVAWLLERDLLKPMHLLWAFGLSVGVIASDGLIRFALGDGIWSTNSVPRLIGILPSSTAMGVYLGAGLACLLALMFSAEKQRFAATIVAIPVSIAVFLTFTRGAWLGVGVVFLLILAIQRHWKSLAAIVGSVGVALLFLALLRPTLFSRIFRLSEGTGSARTEIWASAINAIRHSPIFGLGLDQFAHVDAAKYGIPQLRFLTVAHPHNLILDVWTQLGIVGVIVVIVWVFFTFKQGWLQRKNAIGLALVAIISTLVIHGMLDQTMLGGDLIWLWLMLLILASQIKVTGNQ